MPTPLQPPGGAGAGSTSPGAGSYWLGTVIRDDGLFAWDSWVISGESIDVDTGGRFDFRAPDATARYTVALGLPADVTRLQGDSDVRHMGRFGYACDLVSGVAPISTNVTREGMKPNDVPNREIPQNNDVVSFIVAPGGATTIMLNGVELYTFAAENDMPGEQLVAMIGLRNDGDVIDDVRLTAGRVDGTWPVGLAVNLSTSS